VVAGDCTEGRFEADRLALGGFGSVSGSSQRSALDFTAARFGLFAGDAAGFAGGSTFSAGFGCTAGAASGGADSLSCIPRYTCVPRNPRPAQTATAIIVFMSLASAAAGSGEVTAVTGSLALRSPDRLGSAQL
jgi:hypothetical protein